MLSKITVLILGDSMRRQILRFTHTKVAFAIWAFSSFNQTLKILRVSADLSEFSK